MIRLLKWYILIILVVCDYCSYSQPSQQKPSDTVDIWSKEFKNEININDTGAISSTQKQPYTFSIPVGPEGHNFKKAGRRIYDRLIDALIFKGLSGDVNLYEVENLSNGGGYILTKEHNMPGSGVLSSIFLKMNPGFEYEALRKLIDANFIRLDPTFLSGISNYLVKYPIHFNWHTGISMFGTPVSIAPVSHQNWHERSKEIGDLFWVRYEDVKTVIEQYRKDKPYVIFDTVPSGFISSFPVSLVDTINYVRNVREGQQDELLGRKILDFVRARKAFAFDIQDVGLKNPLKKKSLKKMEVKDFITHYSIMEEKVTDKITGKVGIKVRAIAPLVKALDEVGNQTGFVPLFWIRFEDLKLIVDEYEQAHKGIYLDYNLWKCYFEIHI